jgi:colanic acid biosynthesis glycosyl transferase WcaI
MQRTEVAEPLRIVLYGINHSPEPIGIGKYTGELAAWLASRGHKVKVVTAPPYYPQWRILSGYRRYWYSVDRRNDVDVLRCPLYVPANTGGPRRILHLGSFAASSGPAVIYRAMTGADVVMTIAPTFLCAPLGLIAARLVGAKAWLHIQDFELDIALNSFLRLGKQARRIALRLESTVLRRFDRVSAITPRMVDLAVKKGVAAERSVLLRNWVDTREIFPLSNPSPLRKEFSDGRIIALYSGNFGSKQGLEDVIEAARMLVAREDIVFILCGDGAGRDGLLAQAKGLPNVRVRDLLPAEQLNSLLNAADVHLLPQRAEYADLVMPSKLLGILASGRPVVASARPGTQLAAVAEACGLAIEPGQPAEMAQAVVRLADDPGLRGRLGAAAREYAVSNLDRDGILVAFERALYEVAGT